MRLKYLDGDGEVPTWDEAIQAVEDDVDGTASDVAAVGGDATSGCVVTGRTGKDTFAAKLVRVGQDIVIARTVVEKGAPAKVRNDAMLIIETAVVRPMPEPKASLEEPAT